METRRKKNICEVCSTVSINRIVSLGDLPFILVVLNNASLYFGYDMVWQIFISYFDVDLQS